MHLAESPEEMEFLHSGGGPLREFLLERGCSASEGTPAARFPRPLDYLRRLAEAHRALVIHGNYLNDEEIAFLAANAARMSVVYCPRSHDWFAHDEYPLQKMLAAGATVALGTDGRCSTPDLSLLGRCGLPRGVIRACRRGGFCGWERSPGPEPWAVRRRSARCRPANWPI